MLKLERFVRDHKPGPCNRTRGKVCNKRFTAEVWRHLLHQYRKERDGLDRDFGYPIECRRR